MENEDKDFDFEEDFQFDEEIQFDDEAADTIVVRRNTLKGKRNSVKGRPKSTVSEVAHQNGKTYGRISW